jgi:hypothetical protein
MTNRGSDDDVEGFGDELARSLRLPQGEGALPPLAPARSRADTVLGFNASGGLEYTRLVSEAAVQRVAAVAVSAADAARSAAFAGMPLAAALAAVGNAQATIPIGTVQDIADNITIPPNVALDFFGPGQLNIAAGKTVTVLGYIAPTLTTKIFSGAGAVSFAGNMRMSTTVLDWWGPPARTNDNSPDALPLWQKAVDETPDGWTLLVTGTKGYNWGNASRTANGTLNLRARTKLTIATTWEDWQVSQRVQIQYLGPIGGKVINQDRCVENEIRGLALFCNGADIGIDTDGWVNGQISTANRVTACWIGNAGIAGNIGGPNWIGWRISATATNNNEYMIAQRTTFAGGNKGWGFAMPNAASFNSFGHILDGNFFMRCQRGIYLANGGVSCAGLNNFLGNEYDWYIEQICTPTVIQNIQTEQSHFVGYYNGYSAPFAFTTSRIGSFPMPGEGMFRFGSNASWVEISQNQTGYDVANGQALLDLRVTTSNLRLFLKQNRWGHGPQQVVIMPAARGSGARVSFIGELGHADFTSIVY